MSIIINEPGSVNLKELVQLTGRSLVSLKPWYDAKDDQKSLVLLPISEKAHKYTEAINDSVKAAQYGHDVAGSAMQLATMVQKEGVSKPECDHFAEIMFSCAKNAHAKAGESLEKFRNVRQELMGLISNARKSGDHGHDHDVKDNLDKLEKEGIPVLERLVKCIGKYIDWWSFIAMGANAQRIRAEQLKFKFDKIRGEGAIKKWTALQKDFFEYTFEIGKLQDTYPSMFPGILDAKIETPTTEASVAEDKNIEQLQRVPTVQNIVKQSLAARAWRSFSSFARSLICL